MRAAQDKGDGEVTRQRVVVDVQLKDHRQLEGIAGIADDETLAIRQARDRNLDRQRIRDLNRVAAIILEPHANARVVRNVKIGAVQIRRAGGRVDHVPVAVIQADNVDFVAGPHARRRCQAEDVAGRVISIRVVDALLQEDAVGEDGDGRAGQTPFGPARTKDRRIIHADTRERIGRFKAIHDLDCEVVVGTAGQLYHRVGWVDVIPFGIVIPWIQEHGGGTDEVTAVQRAAVLEHVAALALRRRDVRIVDPQLARGITHRRQNGRIRDPHRRLDRDVLRSIFEGIDGTVDGSGLFRREEIAVSRVDKQRIGIGQGQVEVGRVKAS